VPGNPEPAGAEITTFEGHGGVQIRALLAPAEGRVRGSVILCNGRSEFIEKYFEVIVALQQRGFVVFTMDWRGQGLSGRLTKNPQKGHMDSFDHAVADLAAGLKMAEAHLPRPHLLLAHSMGGAIALRALQKRRIEMDGAVFSSPMWEISGLKPYQRNFARFMTSLGFATSFAPGQPRRWKKEPFRRNPVTRDREHHARGQALILAEPALALAGVTLGWIAHASEMTEGFRQTGAVAHIRAPVVVVSAGDDTLVNNQAHDIIAKGLPNARRVVMDGSKHEILMEKPEIREAFWRTFDSLADVVAPNA
jgi:lysophospholipase